MRLVVLGGLLAVVVGMGAAELLAKPAVPPVPIAPGQATVTLSVKSHPATTVHWGRRLLGKTPLTFKFPKDGGPVDVVLTAPGYVPVHTRLFSFGDDSVSARMTPVSEKKTLFGYKKELPPPPDGGVPPDGGGLPH